MLPAELRPYYAESKLDAGKDDEILMTQKLIIMDDEMGGKSKKESKRLKELTSKQTFTLREPYGKMNVDLNRLAVLCGTTNDLEILNDPTGNRRLLPIQIESIDFEVYNSVDKRLMLIEAYNLWKEGFNWQVNREDVDRMQLEHSKFEEYSKEYELIQKYFKVPESHFNSEMTASDIQVKIEQATGQRLILKRIGAELKRMGFKQMLKKVNGKTARLYEVEEISQLHIPNIEEPMPF
jgi:predicted P-loop ATPase